MLNLYISYAPADHKYLGQLLVFLQPMVEKYNLRVWYNHPEPDPVVPFPWNVLFFWYRPHRSARRPYHRSLPEEVDQAHIYLFLTSQKSVTTAWIEQEEVPRAVSRYQKYGRDFIRILPVSLSASQWRAESRLAGFPTIGPPGNINQAQPIENAWNTLADQLKPIVEELRRNHLEENKRLGLPVDSFSRPPQPWEEIPEEVVPLPQWVGLVIGLLLLWGLRKFWYDPLCTRKKQPYWPKIDPAPVEYDRSRDANFPPTRSRIPAPIPRPDTIPTAPPPKPGGPLEIPVEGLDSSKLIK